MDFSMLVLVAMTCPTALSIMLVSDQSFTATLSMLLHIMQDQWPLSHPLNKVSIRSCIIRGEGDRGSILIHYLLNVLLLRVQR